MSAGGYSVHVSGAGTVQNECGVCGNDVGVTATGSAVSPCHLQLAVPSSSRMSSHSDASATSSQLLLTPASNADDEHFWIQCDVCHIWYHGRCVGVEEYESVLIDSYHCPACVRNQRASTSILKVERNDHRYSFDVDGASRPTQIGTRRFIADFARTEHERFESAESVVDRLTDGRALESRRLTDEAWTAPIVVGNVEGLELRLPPNDTTVDTVVDMLGADKLVDTIDVYRQHTYRMSLGRFADAWKATPRRRLYNIISLEVSKSSLSEVVCQPSVVERISWVHQYWPASTTAAPPSNAHARNTATTTSVVDLPEHHRLKPRVGLFCLIGMRDSYTDFHIDFGGSSVWYHLFKGEKVFYLFPPTPVNLASFEAYSALPDKSERFFVDYLASANTAGRATNQQTCYRLVLKQGETLFMPSGWIHAVFTPVDSIVFGGNFLHSGGIDMQIRVHEMEMKLRTEDRFVFPSFELTNWYACVHLIDHLRDCNHEEQAVSAFFLRGLETLLATLKLWITRDKAKKDVAIPTSFGKAVQQLQKELNAHKRLLKSQAQKSASKRGLANNGGCLLENRKIRCRRPSAKLEEARRDTPVASTKRPPKRKKPPASESTGSPPSVSETPAIPPAPSGAVVPKLKLTVTSTPVQGLLDVTGTTLSRSVAEPERDYPMPSPAARLQPLKIKLSALSGGVGAIVSPSLTPLPPTPFSPKQPSVEPLRIYITPSICSRQQRGGHIDDRLLSTPPAIVASTPEDDAYAFTPDDYSPVSSPAASKKKTSLKLQLRRPRQRRPRQISSGRQRLSAPNAALLVAADAVKSGSNSAAPLLQSPPASALPTPLFPVPTALIGRDSLLSTGARDNQPITDSGRMAALFDRPVSGRTTSLDQSISDDGRTRTSFQGPITDGGGVTSSFDRPISDVGIAKLFDRPVTDDRTSVPALVRPPLTMTLGRTLIGDDASKTVFNRPITTKDDSRVLTTPAHDVVSLPKTTPSVVAPLVITTVKKKAQQAAVKYEDDVTTQTKEERDLLKIFGVSSHGRVQKPSVWVFGNQADAAPRSPRPTFQQLGGTTQANPFVLHTIGAEEKPKIDQETDVKITDSPDCGDVPLVIAEPSVNKAKPVSVKKSKSKTTKGVIKDTATMQIVDDSTKKSAAAAVQLKKDIFKTKKGMATAKQRLANKLGMKTHMRI